MADRQVEMAVAVEVSDCESPGVPAIRKRRRAGGDAAGRAEQDVHAPLERRFLSRDETADHGEIDESVLVEIAVRNAHGVIDGKYVRLVEGSGAGPEDDVHPAEAEVGPCHVEMTVSVEVADDQIDDAPKRADWNDWNTGAEGAGARPEVE